MWLNNYYGKLFAEACVALGDSNTSYKVPDYKNMDGKLVQTRRGEKRPGSNILCEYNDVLGMAAFFTAIVGSMTATGEVGTSGVGMRALFGTGNTPAEVTDYKLDSLIESDLAFGVTVAFDAVGHIVTQTVNVTATAEKVIAEVGLAHGPTLVYRKVLDEPITLAAGESTNVVFTLNLGTGAMSVSV